MGTDPIAKGLGCGGPAIGTLGLCGLASGLVLWTDVDGCCTVTSVVSWTPSSTEIALAVLLIAVHSDIAACALGA